VAAASAHIETTKLQISKKLKTLSQVLVTIYERRPRECRSVVRNPVLKITEVTDTFPVVVVCGELWGGIGLLHFSRQGIS